jgi:uncharacterized protein YgfB (UPF0149 family)
MSGREEETAMGLEMVEEYLKIGLLTLFSGFCHKFISGNSGG